MEDDWKLFKMLKNICNLPRPALEGGHDEEGEHGFEDVVVVELVPGPVAFLHHGAALRHALLVHEVGALARGLVHLRPVRAHPELALQQNSRG